MKSIKKASLYIILGLLISSCKKENTNTIPTVITIDITEITSNSAVVSSEITSNGGDVIIERGICLNTEPNPTISNVKISNSALSGKITSEILGLGSYKKYYVRAYAINSIGVAYGDEKSFLTDSILLPSLGTFTLIKSSSQFISGTTPTNTFPFGVNAHLSGSIISTGGGTIISKGLCWSNKANNSISNSVIIDSTSGNTISATIAHLPIDSIFYARAFATNETGTVYSEEFLINTSSIDSILPGGNIVVYKPNIYIYPKIKTQLQVSLSFPQGGNVIKSIPDYGTGWNVTVEPSGLIDNAYGYLFYESKQPNVWQKQEGWILHKSELKAFFNRNMTEYGFKGQEITDFVDYWIPLLSDEYYSIYPQEQTIINSVITLNISQKPENILRLYYLIEGSKIKPSSKITIPTIDKSFNRNGYFVTEWGVVL